MSVTKLDDLDFGTVTVTGAGAGTITIDPNEDGVAAIAATGPLSVGSDAHAAKFGGAAVKKTVVIIRVPKKDVLMTRQGGTEQMRISDFTVEGNDKKTLAALESFDFKVGGTLHVEDGQVEGLYEGTFNVEIQYP
nr:DUF4402 domain-containing protein [Sphingomicrobium nitratireducens]